MKQSKLLKIISKILSNLFSEKYGLKLLEFNNTTGIERVNILLSAFKLALLALFVVRYSFESLTQGLVGLIWM